MARRKFQARRWVGRMNPYPVPNYPQPLQYNPPQRQPNQPPQPPNPPQQQPNVPQQQPNPPQQQPNPPQLPPNPPQQQPNAPQVHPRYPQKYHADPATLSDNDRHHMRIISERSARGRIASAGFYNVQRPAGHDPNNEPDGDEDADGIVSAKVRYNIKADYPFGISTNYTGSRTRTRNAFPERPISWMKARLGLGKVEWRQHEYEWKPVDQHQVLTAAFTRELNRLMGKHDCEGKQKNRPAWEKVLRDLAKDSKILSPPVKEILLRYTSLSIGYRGPRIRYQDEKWDQERRWMWHALDSVCQKIVENERKALPDQLRVLGVFRTDVGNEWFADPVNHHFPTELYPLEAIDPLTGQPFF